MADETKVFEVKFNITKALSNLEKLDKVLTKVENNKAIKSLNLIEKSLKNIAKEAKTAGNEVDRSLNKKARKSIERLSKTSKTASKNVKAIGTSARKTSISLQKVGQSLRRFVILPLLAVGGASVKFALDMNKAMANVSTMLTGTDEQLEKLKRGVQDMAIETGKGTTDLADGLFQVVSALGESSMNMDQLAIASKAAVAGVTDTTSAVNLLAAVGKGYNDVTSESLSKISDLAFQTVKLGQTTFPEMAASMGRVIPLAAAMNTSQEELFATMATLTGVTGNTAEVSTQLASVYTSFLKPSEAMQDSIKKINKTNKDYNFKTGAAMLKALGFKKSIELLSKSVDGNESKMSAILKRKEAWLAVMPLVTTQADNFTFKLNEMEKSIGATDDAYKKQTEGINAQGHSWEQTKQRMIVFAQRVGDKLLPVLGKMFDRIEPVLEALEAMDDEAIDSAISVGKLAIQFALVVTVLGKMNSLAAAVPGLLSSMSSQMGSTGVAADKLAGKMGKLQQGVALLGALALGFTLGEIINKGLIEPAVRKKEKERVDAENLASGKQATQGSLDKQSITDLQNLRTRQEAKLEDLDTFGHRSFGDVGATMRAQNAGKAFIEKINATIANRKATFDPANQGSFGTAGQGESFDPGLQSNVGFGGGTSFDARTTININGAQNKEAVAGAVERVMRKRDQQLRQQSSGEEVTEQ